MAVVLEYLRRVENNRGILKVEQDDERLKLLAEEYSDDENVMSEALRREIDAFLKGKTKGQLIDLIQRKMARQRRRLAGKNAGDSHS